MSTAAATFDAAMTGALAPLDAVRTLVLRAFGRVLRPLLVERGVRVGVVSFVSVWVTLAFALRFPLWLLSLGPLVLGVPHLLSDVRYLVVRQRLHRDLAFYPLVLTPCLLSGLAARAWVGHLAIAGAVLLANEAPVVRRVLALLVCAALSYLSLSLGWTWDLAFGHLHNLVALALWCSWIRGESPRAALWRIPTLFAFTFGCAVLWFGLGDRFVFGTSALTPPALGADVGSFAATLSFVSPEENPLGALRWVQLFAFMQSVHYAVWLRLVPEEARERAGVRSFASSYRALAREVSRPVVALTALLTVFFCVWGAFALSASRIGYLRLAHGHGHLELAIAALVFCRGGFVRDAASVS